MNSLILPVESVNEPFNATINSLKAEGWKCNVLLGKNIVVQDFTNRLKRRTIDGLATNINGKPLTVFKVEFEDMTEENILKFVNVNSIYGPTNLVVKPGMVVNDTFLAKCDSFIKAGAGGVTFDYRINNYIFRPKPFSQGFKLPVAFAISGEVIKSERYNKSLFYRHIPEACL